VVSCSVWLPHKPFVSIYSGVSHHCLLCYEYRPWRLGGFSTRHFACSSHVDVHGMWELCITSQSVKLPSNQPHLAGRCSGNLVLFYHAYVAVNVLGVDVLFSMAWIFPKNMTVSPCPALATSGQSISSQSDKVCNPL
jgi:hypothetical protein